jgi:glycosyltransferase involved in cell wall biosynthesis
MRKVKTKVCIVTFPLSKAFIVPLSDLQEIMFSFSDQVSVITAGMEDITVRTIRGKASTYKLLYSPNTRNMFARIARYIHFQVKVSLKILRMAKHIDLCIFYMEQGALLPVLTSKTMKKKILWVIPSAITRVGPNKQSAFSIVVVLQDITRFIVDRMVLLSENLLQEWNLEKFKAKIYFAHTSFLDLNKFNVQKEFFLRNELIGYIGRLSAEKGVLNFVEAIPEILKRRPNIGILIGGDGDLREKIEEYIIDNKLSNKVTFANWIPHDVLPKYLNELKIIIIPSYTDAGPRIAFEAMACGTLVLGSKVGMMSQILRDGQNGFVLEKNSPALIADRITAILAMNDLDEVSKNARKTCEKQLTYECAVEQYEPILSDFLK